MLASTSVHLFRWTDGRTLLQESDISHMMRIMTITVLCACVLAGCTSTTDSAADRRPVELVLAGAQEPGGFNPVNGYGELGVSPLYDGLLQLNSSGDAALPKFAPALAREMPTPNETLTQWDVALRNDVHFHDGTTFDAADVVATYDAIREPDHASEIFASLDIVDRVVVVSSDRVQFHLRMPYAHFASRLTLGIVPSERIESGPAEKWKLNREPVGTGPYRLAKLTPTESVFTANESYWQGVPAIRKITTVFVADDNVRAQRMSAGEFDGTILPPLLANTFRKNGAVDVSNVRTADWRAISFPSDNPFTRDVVARQAMNMAVDRELLVKQFLGGAGKPAITPISDVYGDVYDPDVRVAFDRDKARRMLDEAGWRVSESGVRKKGESIARFSVAYRPTDMLRRDLATAFAADMEQIGVEVQLEALNFDAIKGRTGELGIVLGGGDKPYSVDTQARGALHQRSEHSGTWDNPGNYGSQQLDDALDRARITLDRNKQAEEYRSVQALTRDDPSYVFLVFIDHSYVARKTGWNTGNRVVEPHEHGVSWGPWWNVHRWK